MPDLGPNDTPQDGRSTSHHLFANPRTAQFLHDVCWNDCLNNPFPTIRTIPKQCIIRCTKALEPFWEHLIIDPQDELCWKTILIFPRLILRRLPRGGRKSKQRPAISTIHNRLVRFESNDFEGLWTSVDPCSRPQQRKAAPGDGDSSDHITDHTRKRVMFLASLGRIGAAAATLMDTTPFITPRHDNDTIQRLRALQGLPQAAATNPNQHEPIEANDVLFSENTFSEATRSAPKGSGPGPTGWRWEHVNAIVHFGGCRAVYTVLHYMAKSGCPISKCPEANALYFGG